MTKYIPAKLDVSNRCGWQVWTRTQGSVRCDSKVFDVRKKAERAASASGGVVVPIWDWRMVMRDWGSLGRPPRGTASKGRRA